MLLSKLIKIIVQLDAVAGVSHCSIRFEEKQKYLKLELNDKSSGSKRHQQQQQ